MSERFLREKMYRGEDLLQLLKEPITICGVGALGSHLAEALVRVGASNITVIDHDRVSTSNVSTQCYGDGEVGALKVRALAHRLFRDTGTEITGIDKKLEGKNVHKLLKDAALVVDCFDNTESRQLLQDWFRALSVAHNRQRLLHVGLNADYAEVIHDWAYRVPQQAEGDVCDYPLARGIIMLAVVVAAEEILDFCMSNKPRFGNWTITLKDLQIRSA